MVTWEKYSRERHKPAGEWAQLILHAGAHGHVHYLTREQILCAPEREFLYLDEVERETYCKARKCLGQVRMALIRKDSASGFVGGMA